jgi:hypothetical protein
MTKSDFFDLALKLIGFYFFILVFTGLIQFIIMIINSSFNDFDEQLWLYYSGTALNFALYLIFGNILVFRTHKVERLLGIQPDNKELKLTLNKVDLIELALITISVIAIVFSTPRILGNLIEIVYYPATDEFGNSSKSFDDFSYGMTFQLLVGMFLLLNARNFSKMINKRGIKDDEFDKKTRANKGEHEEPL